MSIGRVIGLIIGIGIIVVGFMVAWAPMYTAGANPQAGDAMLGTIYSFPYGGGLGVIGIIVTYLSARTPKPDDVQAVPDKPKTD